MDDIDIYSKAVKEKLEASLNWVVNNVISFETLIQLGIIIIIFLLAKIFAKNSVTWIKDKKGDSSKISLPWFNISYQEILFLFFGILFLWIATLFAQELKVSFQLLKIVASLTSAWAVIRFTSATIKSSFWARTVAITLWVLAALNIIGLLAPTIEFMDKSAVSMGDFNVSLLLVVKSIIAFVLLFWGVGFLSGILEHSFKKAYSLTPSQRVLFYKLSNIMLYAIGAIVGLNIIGLDLTALTVFSGALGFGIGFGLQKVFSNLISGIILLLDKSVKPGDVISIGDTYGWVNSLGARYVSVLTRDGKEHLIPNENLITQEVENWSYSDKKVRVRIPVGVSYSADIHKVQSLLLQAVEENERVLSNPKPVCLLTGFGDSSVDFEIRLWIDNPEDGIGNIKSQIYFRIWDLFKENDIEIPFPQRDINVKSEFFEKVNQLINQDKI
ncbi:MAG: mechanosensitive ion channel [Rickettsiales bacterium]